MEHRFAWAQRLVGGSQLQAAAAQILSGADDSALAHFFDAAPTGHPIYYSYYHEPELPIRQGQFTLAQYKADGPTSWQSPTRRTTHIYIPR